MSNFRFIPRRPIASSKLKLTLISLEDWSLVSVYGTDSTIYLQSQVTLDVTAMNTHQHLLCAHCNAKGKMWSTMRLFKYGEGYAYLVRRSVRDLQINELKRYATFSKVTITANEQMILLGIAGFQARAVLNNHFIILPDIQTQVIQDSESTLLWFNMPTERFLLITTTKKAVQIMSSLEGKTQFNSSQQWLALDIEAGLPVLDKKISAQLIPQAANLHMLGAINFKKGCYIGQEMIARARFLGINKRALYWLSGKSDCIPNTGDALEIKANENWRSTGMVLAAVQLETGDVWIQAILRNDLKLENVLRIQGNASSELIIQQLPYS